MFWLKMQAKKKRNPTSVVPSRHVATQTGLPITIWKRTEKTIKRGKMAKHHYGLHDWCFQRTQQASLLCSCFIFKLSNSLRQMLVDPKDKIARQKESNLVWTIQCSEDHRALSRREMKQPLFKHTAQYRRANPSGQGSAVHLHLKDIGHSLPDSSKKVLTDGFTERLKKPSFKTTTNCLNLLTPTSADN